MQLKNIALALPLALVLAGCGGSSSSNNNPGPAGPGPSDPAPVDPVSGPETGIFLDSPVINIGYRTETLEGVTNENGEYEYEPGETVTFFIGDLEFPPVVASGVVTPLDIAGTTDTSDSKVLNMVRLLQTLDTDGDPGNGITISDAAKDIAAPVADPVAFFSQAIEDFALDAVVTTVIQNGGQDAQVSALVSATQAQQHLEGSLEDQGLGFTNATSLTGGWTLDAESIDEGGFEFFGFDRASGEYIHVRIEVYPDEYPGEDGLEWGSFSLDEQNVLTLTDNFFDENAGTGLNPEFGEGGLVATFSAEGGALSIEFEEEGEQVSLTATRVVANGLAGVWINEIPEDSEAELLVLVFMEDGTYVHAEVEENGAGGAEVGSYSHDTNTGILSISDIIMDTNGDMGASDFVGTGNLSASVTGNIMILSITEFGETEELVFRRL